MWDDIKAAIKDIEDGKYSKAVLPEHNAVVYRCGTVIRIDLKNK
jgi:hypothetical protein